MCGPGHVILSDNQLLILSKYYLIVDSETHKASLTFIQSLRVNVLAWPGAGSAELVQISYKECSQNLLLKMYIYFTPFVIYNGVNKNLAL